MADIPDAALSWTYLRAGGPGGQHQNKTESAVQLRYNIALGELPDDAAGRLKKLAGRRLTDSGDIIIESRDHRSRLMNTNSALRKLKDLIAEAMVEPKKRKPTRPTRASRERRLVSKKQQSEKKTLRKKPLV
ncbi:MAG: alternative ribosome rescue aminoacyl-tRNA hydrolase ArfB [Candidatus Fermentibacteria bacterium]|nr:alternative ribosome rescue aminoacyl-tRNA hydrolase ArfB [Candidatus Fermentibacteria bacterium]